MQSNFFKFKSKAIVSTFITCHSFKLPSNLLFKTLPQSLYIAQSQKIYGIRHSVRADSNPRRRPHFTPPPISANTTLLGGKIIRERQRKGAVGVREAGGGKNMRRQNNYPAAEQLYCGGRGWAKNSKLKSHTAENCRTVPKIPYSIS